MDVQDEVVALARANHGKPGFNASDAVLARRMFDAGSSDQEVAVKTKVHIDWVKKYRAHLEEQKADKAKPKKAKVEKKEDDQD